MCSAFEILLLPAKEKNYSSELGSVFLDPRAVFCYIIDHWRWHLSNPNMENTHKAAEGWLPEYCPVMGRQFHATTVNIRKRETGGLQVWSCLTKKAFDRQKGILWTSYTSLIKPRTFFSKRRCLSEGTRTAKKQCNDHHVIKQFTLEITLFFAPTVNLHEEK